MIKFDRVTWRRFYRIARPMFVSEMRLKAFGMLALLLCFAFAVNGMNVLLSYAGRDFFNSLELKQKEEFFRNLYWYLGTFAAAIPFVVFYRYTEERLDVLWRRWLTQYLMKRYFSNRAYYRLNWSQDGIDNPDQRLAEDVRSFAAQTVSFSLIILNSLIGLYSFNRILWSIDVKLPVAVIVYATLGSIVTYYLGRPLIGLNFAQLKKEADYRYKMINVRDNAETVAFFRGEAKENKRARQRLKIALINLIQLIKWNRNLNFFTTGYNYLIPIIPTIIVAPLYLEGKIPMGVVTQAGGAFAMCLNALSVVVLNFQSISSFGAVITRLGTFVEFLDEAQGPVCDPHTKSCLDYDIGEKVSFDAVSIYTPRRDQLLIKELSFDVEKGGSLFLFGPSGCGKSSVLRVIGGLWGTGNGKIVRPDISRTFFFPQRPYMPLGTLRNLLSYGTGRTGILEKEYIEALKLAELEEMLARVGGVDATMDWPNVLATGEQQKLAFARFFLASSEYAFLDEATTAIDTSVEMRLYEKLRDRVRLYLSVGHHSSLKACHKQVIQLLGDGSWKTVERGA